MRKLKKAGGDIFSLTIILIITLLVSACQSETDMIEMAAQAVGRIEVYKIGPTKKQKQFLGSGTFFVINTPINKRGGQFIITSAHLFDDFSDKSLEKINSLLEIIIETKNKGSFTARLIAVDHKDTDLAALELKDTVLALPSLPLGDSDALRYFDEVFTIGNHRLEPYTASKGYVMKSLVNAEDFELTTPKHLIITNVAINPGSSGSPLMNRSGEVVGINVKVWRDFHPLTLSVPVNDLKAFLYLNRFK